MRSRVRDAARELGLSIELRTLDDSTATSQEAAAAIGCDIGQIAKAIVFVCDGEPVVCIATLRPEVSTPGLAVASGFAIAVGLFAGGLVVGLLRHLPEQRRLIDGRRDLGHRVELRLEPAHQAQPSDRAPHVQRLADRPLGKHLEQLTGLGDVDVIIGPNAAHGSSARLRIVD